MEIRRITRENAGDLRLKNEPFAMPGQFIPALSDGVWTYRIQAYPQCRWMTFPDEAYDFDALEGNSVIFGAYEDGACVGLAIFQDYYFGYMYLLDLKVRAAARGRGAGKALIEAGMTEARKRGYLGLFTQAQDNNLNACMFYLKAGFTIGGFDNRVYRGTKQEGKADIIFYKE
ncbi:MAG: GNAT family N-acetyltransferase [Faecousia sp.]